MSEKLMPFVNPIIMMHATDEIDLHDQWLFFGD